MAILVTVVLILGVSLWAMSRSLSYPIPRGEFKVGTVILDLEDSSRTEWALPEEHQNRKFVARIWYPAKPTSKEAILPIMEIPYSKGMNKLYGFPVGKEKHSYSRYRSSNS